MTPQVGLVKDFDVSGSNDDSEWILLGSFQHGNNPNLETSPASAAFIASA